MSPDALKKRIEELTTLMSPRSTMLADALRVAVEGLEKINDPEIYNGEYADNTARTALAEIEKLLGCDE